MNLSPLTALSPLDGRYATKVAPLRALLSEYGLMHRRVQVEVEWFIALSDAGLPEFAPLTAASRSLLRERVSGFSEVDAQAIKDIERTTNHDVKAVEYYLKETALARDTSGGQLAKKLEFFHFACTSEDINNLAYARMLVCARAEALVPAGANKPFQAKASNPGKPASATVGKSGRAASRCGLVTASNLSRPPCTKASKAGSTVIKAWVSP